MEAALALACVSMTFIACQNAALLSSPMYMARMSAIMASCRFNATSTTCGGVTRGRGRRDRASESGDDVAVDVRNGDADAGLNGGNCF